VSTRKIKQSDFNVWLKANCDIDIIKMLKFLIDNIFAICGCVFQQTAGIHMATNCVLLYANLFLYLYYANFIQRLLKFYCRHHDLVNRYEAYVSQMTTNMFHL